MKNKVFITKKYAQEIVRGDEDFQVD